MPRPADPTLPDRILKAAESVVVAEGHEALNMRTLARLARVSATTIYAHFSSKAALRRALELRVADRLNESIRRIDPTLEPFETLAEIGRQYIAFAEANPRLYRLMFDGLDGTPISDEERSVMYFTYYSARNALERAATSGLIPHQPAYSAMMGWSMLHGFASLMLSGRLQLAEDMDQEQLQELFMAFYAGPH
ncbi:MAG: TetR/AcrR family transcriptional regulator [Proteobacteria bacterium]|jgi:AcrR family transcriptional regulator|nr:TetR/AcrR family transcriptional regulator [Pseudomonadota bacterium]